MSSDLVDTTEMYLKAIYVLEEEGVPPLRARLVERLGQSKPTVSETVARLERDGLLTIVGTRSIALSLRGRKEATEVMRKHRLAERLLLEVIGVPWQDVHDEACRWEHVMSKSVEGKIAALLAGVTTDPFGNPIPVDGLDGPGAAAAGPAGLIRVVDFLEAHPEGGPSTVARIGEVLQTDSGLLVELHQAGILPGSQISLVKAGANAWTIEGTNGSVELTAWIASHLLLKK